MTRAISRYSVREGLSLLYVGSIGLELAPALAASWVVFTSAMSTDFDDYLRYRRPAGFQFEFPAGKKFVWARKGEKRERTYTIAEVLDESDPNNIVIRIRDTAEVPF